MCAKIPKLLYTVTVTTVKQYTIDEYVIFFKQCKNVSVILITFYMITIVLFI